MNSLKFFRILKTVNDDVTETTILETFKMTGAPTNLDETGLSHCLKISSTGQKEHQLEFSIQLRKFRRFISPDKSSYEALWLTKKNEIKKS